MLILSHRGAPRGPVDLVRDHSPHLSTVGPVAAVATSLDLQRSGALSVFDHESYDEHEHVARYEDKETGLRAVLAVHDTSLGPALGGIRMRPYECEEDALDDALRLSRGMTYKSAIARLPFGGGMCVVSGDPRVKTPSMLRALGRFIHSLGGRCIAIEDSGTTASDLRLVAQSTPHVAGIGERCTHDGKTRSGDSSPATAYGVFVGIQAAVHHRFNRPGVKGLRVAVQGAGQVGRRLSHLLVEAGARVWISDLRDEAVIAAARELGVEAVPPDEIFDVDADIFAPCAMGAMLSDETIPRLNVPIVAGCASNQLRSQHHGRMLMERGILHAPDYVINAGGAIDLSCGRIGAGPSELLARIEAIGTSLREIFAHAALEGVPPGVVAERVARERIQAVGQRRYPRRRPLPRSTPNPRLFDV